MIHLSIWQMLWRNFVCSANLGMRFDLTDLLMKSQKRAELVPKKNCILMKIPSPDTTAMLFSNGKLVVTGANSEEEVKTAARKFTQIIQVRMQVIREYTRTDACAIRKWIILAWTWSISRYETLLAIATWDLGFWWRNLRPRTRLVASYVQTLCGHQHC